MIVGFIMIMFMITVVMVVIIRMIAVGLVLMRLMLMRLMLMSLVIVSFVIPGLVVMMFGIMRVGVTMVGLLLILIGLWRPRGVECVFDDRALDAVATAAPSRVAVTGAAPVTGAVLTFLFGFAVGALVRFNQRLTVGDGNLVIVRMNFAEGEEAVAVAAVVDEGRLERGLHAGDLGEIDIAA